MTVTPRANGNLGQKPNTDRDTNKKDETDSTKLENTEGTPAKSPLIEDVGKALGQLDIVDETQVVDGDFDENGEPCFPMAELARLDEMVSNPRWVIPVLPNGELEVLLEATIRLTRKRIDEKSEACQRFIKDGLTISFNKILLDDAVNTWKFEIHKCILKNAEKLVQLCVLKLEDDWFPLLDLLAILFNPSSRFHIYNAARPSETHSLNSEISSSSYARPVDQRQPKGWLVDLLNKFGNLHGFSLLEKRVTSNSSLNIHLICALIKPFGYCAEYLSEETIEQYFMPAVLVIKSYLDTLTDTVLKKESKGESKNEAISLIIKSLKSLVAKLPDQEELCRDLEKLRLKMILRLLQISSFNGKMNALNEINRVICNVSYYSHHRHAGFDDDEFLTSDIISSWLQENKVLAIVLKDNLHQPQYVEKLEKIIRFSIKARTLTLEDLNTIWDAQIGKHEAIVKNVHDLLAKLAWDFSAEQLDHLFSRFQVSWNEASKKQQEKLLELIRRLAEDDKEGVIAHKVLGLLWQLAHSDDLPTDIMDQALVAHIKILDFSCSQTQNRDNLKLEWINHCVDELHCGQWVLPALKQIRAICELFGEQGYTQVANPIIRYRNVVIETIQNDHGVVRLVAVDLDNYMKKIRSMYSEQPSIDPNELKPDGRYPHMQQIQERLDFLRFILNDGKMWLCEPQAKQIWICLAIDAVFPCDRDACFKWFSLVMGHDPDLDPDVSRIFFEQNVLNMDPSLLTEQGIKCFERFFKFVNTRECNLSKDRNDTYILESTDLIGYDYLWKLILQGTDSISNRAIEIMKEIFTNLSPNLKAKQVEVRDMFMNNCMVKLNSPYEILQRYKKEKSKSAEIPRLSITTEAKKIVLCLKVMKEYMAECDNCFVEDRSLLPHARACRGKHVTLFVRFAPQSRQAEDFEIWSHTNESVAAVRRQIYSRLRTTPQAVKVDLFCNGELLNHSDDHRLVGQIPLRDRTVLNVKLGAVGSSSPSSPGSSSDSSPPMTPLPNQEPSIEAEQALPSVMMAKSRFVHSLFSFGDLGVTFNYPELRDIVLSLLRIMPTDFETIKSIKVMCQKIVANKAETRLTVTTLFIIPYPIRVLYNLEVVYMLLMPASQPYSEVTFEFQRDFVLAGGIDCIANLLMDTKFLEEADITIRRSAYIVMLKLSKLFCTVLGQANITAMTEMLRSENRKDIAATAACQNIASVKMALQHIPNPYQDCVLRGAALKLGQTLGQQITSSFSAEQMISTVQRMAWLSSAGRLDLFSSTATDPHSLFLSPESCATVSTDDAEIAREALELLPVVVALHTPIVETLCDSTWQNFVLDLVLRSSNVSVRTAACDQFFLIATKCGSSHKPSLFYIDLLLSARKSTVVRHASQCSEFFLLLCNLLKHGQKSGVPVNNVSSVLCEEISWLRDVQAHHESSHGEDLIVEHQLLEGHLCVARDLVAFQTPQKKHTIGSYPDGDVLVKHLTDSFVFTASKMVLETRLGGRSVGKQVSPVCSTPTTISAALDLLVALCTGCVENFRQLADTLNDVYYTGEPTISEWEYQPPIGPRVTKGYVGLKNAGATCYMNSVLQQLYMIPEVRSSVLNANMSNEFPEEEIYDDETDKIHHPEVGGGDHGLLGAKDDDQSGPSADPKSADDQRKEYNVKVLRQVQAIFGHLAKSKIQYHVPRGFWKTFRLWGEPVNLREQHDALEFFNTLVDNVDEGLKAIGKESALSNVLGGLFADQKICKECPHRYSRETPFIALNVDVRHQHNLTDSLEQYVKGDLLEGANAYYCEKCDKKVDTVKRMCIKKLPQVLAIQLKRFDYDWERDCAVKFNDYFEFPREFDMEPFTVDGLARIEGESIEDDITSQRTEAFPSSSTSTTDAEKKAGDNIDPGSRCTIYKLTGVVVHSGQASGGHYYSYIIPRPCLNGVMKWQKFDDGDVSECNMDDDEEMKNQCFGGEYTGEVFDHTLKQMAYRRQKRWWNAYILFYERTDISEMHRVLDPARGYDLPMPNAIERAVTRQNIRFLHYKTQFSPEYFKFIRNLVTANLIYFQSNSPNQNVVALPDREELGLISVQLFCNFLFTVGFHTKKTIRGSALEWYEVMNGLLRQSIAFRRWFACNVLLLQPTRISEYLFDCPIGEIRMAFVKIVVLVAHLTRQDGPWDVKQLNHPLAMWQVNDIAPESATLSDYLLKTFLEVLLRETTESSKNLMQYFHLFVMYAAIGIEERKQLIDLKVLQTFVRILIEEDRSSGFKYQYNELGKLYSLVSMLIRSCDVSKFMKSAIEDEPPKPNLYFDPAVQQPIAVIPDNVAGLVYSSNHVKRLLDDGQSSEETISLLKFLSWECVNFSLIALSEVLFQISYTYCYELRPYLDILLHLLLMEDSWQKQRLYHAFRGVSDDREGLFGTIQRSKVHSQKRCYQCIKAIVRLISNCELANEIIQSNEDLREKWKSAVQWLGSELDRRATSAYNYNNWSPPVQSNESSNGYFLERSHSARITYAKACDFIEADEEEAEADTSDSLAEDERPSLPGESEQTPTDADELIEPILTTDPVDGT